MKTLLSVIITVAFIALLAWVLRQHRAQHPPTNQVAPAPRALKFVNGDDSAVAAHHPVSPVALLTKAKLLAYVHAHESFYLGFDANSATLQRTANGRFVYSMYRIGEHTAWTRHMIFLPADSAVWIDANGEMVRAECGNPLSVIPQGAPTPAELAQILTPTVEAPPIPGGPSPVPQNDAPPIVVPPGAPGTPFYPVPCCLVPYAPPAPPAKVSEPSLLSMLVGGWSVVFTVFYLAKKRPRS